MKAARTSVFVVVILAVLSNVFANLASSLRVSGEAIAAQASEFTQWLP